MKSKKIIILVGLVVMTATTWAGFEVLNGATLDFPLYKNERYFGGSKPIELASFVEGSGRVLRAQAKLAAKAYPGPSLPNRVFHAKSHGCYTGKLILYKNRPGDPERATEVGLFDSSSRDFYDVIVRFSNGFGLEQDDKLPDIRGVAIKVFDVENLATYKRQTVDLLMINLPKPPGRDFRQFIQFMDRLADYGSVVGGLLFLAHVEFEPSLVTATGIPFLENYKTKSMATIRYWSGHPYLLGPNRAMKFNISPTEKAVKTEEELIAAGNPGFLKIDLQERLRFRPVSFKFNIQLEKDPANTPIEDNLHEWTEENSPSIPVAELRLDQQEGNPEINEACDSMRFTPGHFVPQHRPLSNMGRGRLFGYEASQIGRHAKALEPSVELVQEWRRKNGAR